MKLLNYLLSGLQLFAVVFAIQYLLENDPTEKTLAWFFWLVAGCINASGLINELRTPKE